MDDLQQQLAEAFAAELAEHLAVIRAGLTLAAADGRPDLRDIFRRAHSLKGAARAVDREDVETIAHSLETLLADIEQGVRPLQGVAIVKVRELLNAIEDATAGPALDGKRDDEQRRDQHQDEERPDRQHDDRKPDHQRRVNEPAEPGPAPEPTLETIRISSRRVDQLAEAIRALQGDLEARRLDSGDRRGARAEIEAIRNACLAPGARLPDIATRLTRLLASSHAVAARQATADGQVERSAFRLGLDAEAILLAPAAVLAEGQERAFRALAADAGKKADLVLLCDPVEADRGVLQSLRDPLTHLIRNAVSHGVEHSEDRVRAGKSERATVVLEVREQQGQLLLAVEDDGPGPNVAGIISAARARGIAVTDAVPSEEAALPLVFEHGVSTSVGVDRLSGRGVGLSAVASVVRRLHGAVRMLRGAQGGTRIELVVPLALTRRTVLLVEAAGQLFAIPTRAASRAVRFPAARIEMQSGLPVLLEAGDRLLPLVSLAALLGLPTEGPGEQVQAFLLHAVGRECLVVVDALSDVRTLALRDAEEIAADVPLVLGTALVEDGGLAIVLSPEQLVERHARGRATMAAQAKATERRRQQTILVVDDSITTRTLERGILEGHGYRVLLSVDGLDGLAALRAGAGTIDLVVADVEMPRMDGFGLVAAIRNDPTLADIPVVLMTSRNSPEDIQRGLDLGANAYVTKQEFEQGSLLATVGRLI